MTIKEIREKESTAPQPRAGRAAEAPVRPAQPGGHGEAGRPQPAPQDEEGHRPDQDGDPPARARTGRSRRSKADGHDHEGEQPWESLRQCKQTVKKVIGSSDAKDEQSTRPLLRTIEGVVASDKGDKTIKVVVNYQTKHPKYGKYLKRRTVLHAHDEKNEAKRRRHGRDRRVPPAQQDQAPPPAPHRPEGAGEGRAGLGGRSDDRQGAGRAISRRGTGCRARADDVGTVRTPVSP